MLQLHNSQGFQSNQRQITILKQVQLLQWQTITSQLQLCRIKLKTIQGLLETVKGIAQLSKAVEEGLELTENYLIRDNSSQRVKEPRKRWWWCWWWSREGIRGREMRRVWRIRKMQGICRMDWQAAAMISEAKDAKQSAELTTMNEWI
jgi:hypothetical protein